ncbi:Clavaminate synthase-like protein [Rhizopus microsporus var. microsporus]|uniref:Clavaminate synthase-like protein n=2 Tax=Rhizopus microsporus TaxID=58291 RepID=A0A2G4SR99_RHIZD|nr:Clavaminate synthase-like protein [Rhizopus microsporus ATCC 52813]ORE06427.1 Clavaminate synthase-like protein [Rhizopus microsporus var. microsporus]PHZ11299.1 Clavaminate synthase-like protein [Rhizopus microsporus ATCC 52813]
MTFTIEPIVPSAKQSGVDFGAIINDLDLEKITPEDFDKLYEAVYTYQVVVVRNQGHVTPHTQYELTKRFDPQNIDMYGHGGMYRASESVIARDISPLPVQPQVQLLGNGIVRNHCGIDEKKLVHPSHTVFHKTPLTKEQMDAGYTRFYRWHMDAALYKLNPPKVTTLFGIKNPSSRREVVRYDDGTGDELEVQLGTTAFISGQKAFEILSPEMKELAFKTQVKYAAHPYVWISKAKAHSTGLGMVSEGKELPKEELPPIDEKDIKIYPMLWKNPVTNKIHLQVHPAAVEDLIIDGKPVGDLEKVRELIYKIQRPGISPENVYAHEWKDGDFVIFHNRGVLHSVVGSLREDDFRLFHQCNIASADEPVPVTEQDFAPYKHN